MSKQKKRIILIKRSVMALMCLWVFSASFVYAQGEMTFKDSSPNAFASSPVLIFVSFSMPKTSLKAWLEQAQKIHAPIFIRGLVHNSFKETSKAVQDLLTKDEKDSKKGFLIDPREFAHYSITQVPAVVVPRSNDDFDVVYGDITLDYALEKIDQCRPDSSLHNTLSDSISLLRRHL